MNKKLIVSIFLASLLCIMVGSVVQAVLFNPTSSFASTEGNWGDEYTNDKGQHICICDPVQQDCRPCYDIPPGQQ